MTWIKEVGRRGGDGAWRDDFPLDHELSESLRLDCSRLELPIHPMFAVRLRVFVDWHQERGRQIELIKPIDSRARAVFDAMGIARDSEDGTEADTIMPVTRLAEFAGVESVAARTKEILEYQLTDVSPLGDAAFMAVSELCGNAIDHGSNPLGAYAAVRRVTQPRKMVTIAISDLGMVSRSTSGRLAANGHCQIQVVQETRKVEVLHAPRFRCGTWITYDLVSV